MKSHVPLSRVPQQTSHMRTRRHIKSLFTRFLRVFVLTENVDSCDGEKENFSISASRGAKYDPLGSGSLGTVDLHTQEDKTNTFQMENVFFT